jgi:hypothetical protein
MMTTDSYKWLAQREIQRYNQENKRDKKIEEYIKTC